MQDRKQIEGLKHKHNKDVAVIKDLLSISRGENQSVTANGRGEGTEVSAASRPSAALEEPDAEDSSVLTWSAVKPIGYVSSVFKTKNGTPRQSGVVPTAKATLTLLPNLFTNPNHSLEGLQQFSHIWVIFAFHQNKNNYTKAKVQPPRLNGAKVGLFSTRSPYRPNPIGLSLVALDAVKGSTLHISGVDMTDGTPVLDIKPYIPQYDGQTLLSSTTPCQANNEKTIACGGGDLEDTADTVCHNDNSSVKDTIEAAVKSGTCIEGGANTSRCTASTASTQVKGSIGYSSVITAEDTRMTRASSENKSSSVHNNDAEYVANCESRLKEGSAETPVCDLALMSTAVPMSPDSEASVSEEKRSVTDISVAQWITSPPTSMLTVCFSSRAEGQLVDLKCDLDRGFLTLTHFNSIDEVKEAIMSILRNDPRSTYRRIKCADRLYYFSVDVIHVTSWFDDEYQTAEVLKLKWKQNPT